MPSGLESRVHKLLACLFGAISQILAVLSHDFKDLRRTYAKVQADLVPSLSKGCVSLPSMGSLAAAWAFHSVPLLVFLRRELLCLRLVLGHKSGRTFQLTRCS